MRREGNFSLLLNTRFLEVNQCQAAVAQVVRHYELRPAAVSGLGVVAGRVVEQRRIFL